MTRPYVYVTRKLPDEHLESLREHAEVECWEKADEPVPRNILLEKAAGADALLTMLSDQVDTELLEQAPNLKAAANLAVGFDNIDVDACSRYGVVVCNTPDVLTEATADLGFALLMASARRMTEAEQYIKDDKWTQWGPYMFAGADVYGASLGIIGMGRIGEAVAARASGFRMKVSYNTRTRRKQAENELGVTYQDKETLLKESDFVMLTAPLTPETKHMIGRNELALMKPEAHLINIGRGPLVDEQALYEALKNKELAGAGLDVFEEEPIRASHPLLELPQVTALPHIGSATTSTRNEMIRLAARNIAGVLSGEGALTQVNGAETQ
ncbi:2-hydroxyacid dehydrogenase [Alkalicoccus luteus]|uniref:D-glycerate dehydrogenase n=1 Tax=Alkalicoccus luteus TaxID=1237094 RepID=A0A969PQ24_9BACI|nr:D-glycerate dehydrogenase [Alkalicoccus luteus]NJP38277.1 D-glycerate dehydrogenase [Alkalicoccus luteus]